MMWIPIVIVWLLLCYVPLIIVVCRVEKIEEQLREAGREIDSLIAYVRELEIIVNDHVKQPQAWGRAVSCDCGEQMLQTGCAVDVDEERVTAKMYACQGCGRSRTIEEER